MAFCNICKFQVFDTTVSACPNCGAPLENPEKDEGAQEHLSAEDTLPNSQISDGHDSKRDFKPPPRDDDLQICDPGEFLCSEQAEAEESNDEKSAGQASLAKPDESGKYPDKDDKKDSDSSQNANSSIKKLSDEQVNNIRSNLLKGDSEYVTAQDASSIIHDLSRSSEGPTLQRQNSGDSASPAKKPPPELSSPPVDSPPENLHAPDDLPSPKAAPNRRVAYFHKNFIQLTGAIHPTPGEEMVIDDRHYILKQKKIKPQYTIGMFSVLAVLLLFIIGKQFISPTLPGNGSIIGIILDESGRPLISGAEIALPESGKKTVSNPIGFFRFDNVPTGVYVIRYILPDGRIGSDNISVANDEITMLSLDSDGAKIPVSSRASNDNRGSTSSARSDSRSRKMPPVPEEKRKESSSSESRKAYSEIKLRANVDNATLIVDGEVIGVGNVTYKKLAPGDHVARVTKDGHKAWSGNIYLDPDETYTLSVALEKLQEESAEQTYSADDFYQSGRTMLADGNIDAAIQDFTEAIKMKPSLADAYAGRADAYKVSGKSEAAGEDYIRAGEIYASQKRNQSAMTCFNKAIDLDGVSVVALLNRGDLHRRADRKEQAIEDYQTVLKHDRNNFRANFELGKIYFSSANHKDADKMLRKARDIDASNPEVYHYLMLNYFARDDFGKVKKTYGDFKDNVSDEQQQAFRSNPRFDAILRIVGEYERP